MHAKTSRSEQRITSHSPDSSSRAPAVNELRSPSVPLKGSMCTVCQQLLCTMSFVALVLILFFWPSTRDAQRSEAFRKTCDAALELPGGTGFLRPPTDSTVLLLFDVNTSREQPNQLQQWFSVLAAASVSVQQDSDEADQLTPQAQFLEDHGATAWVVDHTRRRAKPLQMDVVYTYVNESTPDFAERLRRRGFDGGSAKFFRDWGELRYSLRSLWHGVMDPSSAAARVQREERREREEAVLGSLGLTIDDTPLPNRANSASACPVATFSFIRRVILVVSGYDQVPHWVSSAAEDGCGVHIVRHDELFSSAEQADGALPTFNSLAIESTLHRIPGLSRFWWYFNNDMLIARPVTLLDLFRPLSPTRQRTRFENYALGEDDQAAGEVRRSGSQPLPWESVTTAHQWPIGAAALWLEPFFHSDHSNHNVAFSSDLLLRLNDGVVKSAPLHSASDPFFVDFSTDSTEVTRHCAVQAMRTGLVGGSPWRTTAFTAPGSVLPPPACRNALNRHAHYVAKTALEGVPPTMIYAHLPQVFDTEVFARMLEDPVDGLVDEAHKIRLAYYRHLNNFSPVHVYGLYALAMRRAVERDMWWRLHDGTFATVSAQTRTESATTFPYCRVCPLCAHTATINLQHPEMHRELAAWWPLNASLTHSKTVSTTAGDANEAKVCIAETLADEGADQRLEAHYRALIASSSNATMSNVSLEKLMGLFSDVFHHANGGILRFIMVEDLIQLAMKNHVMGELMRHPSTRPLFVTINDDLRNDEVIRARSNPRNWELHTTLFARLLGRCAYRGDVPCPFERQTP